MTTQSVFSRDDNGQRVVPVPDDLQREMARLFDDYHPAQVTEALSNALLAVGFNKPANSVQDAVIKIVFSAR
ncbi:hypothetical protein XM38_006320 [Halomicronema hongdechloris C2206]|uniref:Uncharacterized protein n=1 Tax=Halomicronema hongdechloris C2206 TaxID=1641165 RepID=A0A1Z3HHG4_9CYAN|nr:hypothetical protein [Halomicronema hongdechloris]ASC69703.1 hypothetical protein XM38_006320 [Halomicronema hongdechloris C2206]